MRRHEIATYSKSSKSYLSFCLIVRNAAATLERTLKSLRKRAPNAEIVIVDTMSNDAGIDFWFDKAEVLSRLTDAEKTSPHLAIKHRIEAIGYKVLWVRLNDETYSGIPAVYLRVRAPDGKHPYDFDTQRVQDTLANKNLNVCCGKTTQQIAQEYADVYEEYRGPNGDWTAEMEWFDDAAAARNRSFELANSRWIGWIDADDELVDPEEAERILKANGRWKPPPQQICAGLLDKDGFKGLEPSELPTLEEILLKIEQSVPNATCVYAPYAYEFETTREAGNCVVWQDRERFVRVGDDGVLKYCWTEAGHEVLVPTDDSKPPFMYLASLLFVHLKEHTPDDRLYSLRRHFDVLMKKYLKGERTTRNLLYLANYAPSLAPTMEKRFLDEALDAAVLDVERVRAHVSLGNYLAARGLYKDALSQYSAATTFRPDLPDGWLALGEAAFRAEDWIRAANAFERAAACVPGLPDSLVPPRQVKFRAPLMQASALQEQAALDINWHRHQEAAERLKLAHAIAREVAKSPDAGVDAYELQTFEVVSKNKFEMQMYAIALHQQWDLLRRNDETLKAVKLLNSVPSALEDHPFVMQIEEWAKSIVEHVTNPEAYEKFYNSNVCTDVEPTPVQLIQEGSLLPRTIALIDALKRKTCEDGRTPADPFYVIEFGPFDGVNAIPVLRACPNVVYVAVDAQRQALQWMRERAEKFVPDGCRRLITINGTHEIDAETVYKLTGHETFDAVVLFEVIEHVPNPESALFSLRRWMNEKSSLFVSTPWQAYDQGSPPNMTERDPRGHVRAMSMKEVYEALHNSGYRTKTAVNHRNPFDIGNTMFTESKLHHPALGNVAFFVMGAHWKWNASHVYRTGIGASEKTIVFLAKHLSEENHARPYIFGPMQTGANRREEAGEEIIDGVAYWNQQKVRHIGPDTKLIVSRAPGAMRTGLLPRKRGDILWLQDVPYPDLNADTAADFDKIVVLSEWHRKRLAEVQNIPEDCMTVIENFILPYHFKQTGIERQPFKFIYSSSPDRGLFELLRIWPRIKEKLPEAELHVFYGWQGITKMAASNPSWAKDARKMRAAWDSLKYLPGVIERGRVNHETLAREMMSASALLYPCRFFDEAHCTTMVEARAAGLVPVTTKRAALEHTARSKWTRWVDYTLPEKDFDEAFVQATLEAIETSTEVRKEMSKEALDQNSIEVILPHWLKILGL